MRLQDEALQTVRPRDFYLAILVVVVLLVAMGIHLMETGTVPSVEPRFWLVALAVLWAVTLARFLKYRPQPFPRGLAALLIGVTLQVGSRLMLPDSVFRPWVEGSGVLLMLVGFAARVFHTSGRRTLRPPPPPVRMRDHRCSPVFCLAGTVSIRETTWTAMTATSRNNSPRRRTRKKP